MRLLFEIDTKDYDPAGVGFIRHSARCIAIRHGKIALVHSKKYDYYKFPGGGIEAGEHGEDAVIRETLEEAGLVVVPSSIREFGYVHRIQKSEHGNADYFLQDNFYYLCDVLDRVEPQALCDYEADERFTFEWCDPRDAIYANLTIDHGPKDKNMIEREAKVLQILIKEGYFDESL